MIEFGSIEVDVSKLIIVDKWSEFIKPPNSTLQAFKDRISPRIYDDLKDAKSFSQVSERIYEGLHG